VEEYDWLLILAVAFMLFKGSLTIATSKALPRWETAHKRFDFRGVCLRGKMSRVEQVNLCIWQVAPVGFCASRQKCASFVP
jgi:hypothetical protein